MRCLAFLPDGSLLVSASHDGSVTRWHATTGEKLQTLWHDHTDSNSPLILSPDGTTLASGAQDGTVRVRDTQQLKSLCALHDLASRVEGLRALLLMAPQVGTIGLARDAASVHAALTQHHPVLVVLDAGLPGAQASAVVKTIKAHGHRTRCLVLADDAQQEREAETAGADVALIKGFLASKLFKIMEDLLPKRDISRTR